MSNSDSNLDIYHPPAQVVRNYSDIRECTNVVMHLCHQFVTDSDEPPSDGNIFVPLPPGMTAFDIAEHIYNNYFYDIYAYIHAQDCMELCTTDEVEEEVYEYITNAAHEYVYYTNPPESVGCVLRQNCSHFLYHSIFGMMYENFPNHRLYQYLNMPWKDFLPPNSVVDFKLLVPRDIIVCCLQHRLRELEVERNNLLSAFKTIRSKQDSTASDPAVLNSSKYKQFQRKCSITVEHIKQSLSNVIKDYTFCQRMIPEIRDCKRFNIYETREESLIRLMKEENLDKRVVNKIRKMYAAIDRKHS